MPTQSNYSISIEATELSGPNARSMADHHRITAPAGSHAWARRKARAQARRRVMRLRSEVMPLKIAV